MHRDDAAAGGLSDDARVPLRNPVNDVKAMAQRFRELGFTVFVHENATKRTMEAAIVEFGRRLAEGGVGAFYCAGHGLQVRGRNYLVPVDAVLQDEASARVAAVDVDLLLEQMAEAKNRVNLVMLDAAATIRSSAGCGARPGVSLRSTRREGRSWPTPPPRGRRTPTGSTPSSRTRVGPAIAPTPAPVA